MNCVVRQAYADLSEQAQAVEEAQAAARHAADEAAGLREELGSRIDAGLAAEEAAQKAEEAAQKAAAEAEALAAANAAAVAENERLKRQLKELSASVRIGPCNILARNSSFPLCSRSGSRATEGTIRLAARFAVSVHFSASF